MENLSVFDIAFIPSLYTQFQLMRAAPLVVTEHPSLRFASWALFRKTTLNALSCKIYFYSYDVVSRYREIQLEMSENT